MDIENFFTESDFREIEKRGIPLERIVEQIEIFRRGIPPVKLHRPATIDDGIIRIPETEQQHYREVYLQAAAEGRALKFVPASGAATRMMKTLVKVFNESRANNIHEVSQLAEEGEQDYQLLLRFLNNLPRFAFYNDLKTILAQSGKPIETLLREGQFRDILAALLLPDGLNYANLPKGLIKFHDYPGGSRTPFEEHLVEAVYYTADKKGITRIHFTIAPEHEEMIKSYIASVLPRYETDDIRFDISYSFQKPSTDTIAVDLNNTPVRDAAGKLVFRPGGHGALLENLNDLQGDIVFIKNIDNVVPDRLKSPTYHYKMVLGGYLIHLQNRVFQYLHTLDEGVPPESALAEIFAFAREELYLDVPGDIRKKTSPSQQRDFLLTLLNRPIRVCGMVKNEGEPGGGPFWVASETNSLSLQIVESAQVDMNSEEQRHIWESSTHFNPVDLVCGVRDYCGKPFHLPDFTDPRSGFITIKSLNGKDIKALELPGLWNGAMANWITVFVEVPIITFNPVKTIFDLLRKEHQPE